MISSTYIYFIIQNLSILYWKRWYKKIFRTNTTPPVKPACSSPCPRTCPGPPDWPLRNRGAPASWPSTPWSWGTCWRRWVPARWRWRWWWLRSGPPGRAALPPRTRSSPTGTPRKRNLRGNLFFSHRIVFVFALMVERLWGKLFKKMEVHLNLLVLLY